MKNPQNKEELYEMFMTFLHERSLEKAEMRIYVTKNSRVLSNRGPSFFEPSNHIEADTRVALFVKDALQKNFKRILVRTGDTDVIFILVGQCRKFLLLNKNLQLFVDMHTSSSNKGSSSYIDIVKIATSIGINRSVGLPLLHAYSGCDYTPSFYGIGKSKWFDTYLLHPEVMDMFTRIVENPESVQEAEIVKITQYTLAVYGVDDPKKGLLEGRFDRLTSKKINTFRSLPPSPGAAIIQFRKAVHIAAHIWGKACEPEITPPDMCSPLQGWKKVGENVEHIWTVTPEPTDKDRYACCKKTCGCRRKQDICQGRCSCRDADMPCLYLCKCRRKCAS
ncbi:uncharacterized protein LOC134825850 [Bolinopsis microptera]|uniref:uncharacterized protein LOC134825850 n=1 Tax=Bolinopsis microptera TaxID=2820187 RepID=UPI00307A05C7